MVLSDSVSVCATIQGHYARRNASLGRVWCEPREPDATTVHSAYNHMPTAIDAVNARRLARHLYYFTVARASISLPRSSTFDEWADVGDGARLQLDTKLAVVPGGTRHKGGRTAPRTAPHTLQPEPMLTTEPWNAKTLPICPDCADVHLDYDRKAHAECHHRRLLALAI